MLHFHSLIVRDENRFPSLWLCAGEIYDRLLVRIYCCCHQRKNFKLELNRIAQYYDSPHGHQTHSFHLRTIWIVRLRQVHNVLYMCAVTESPQYTRGDKGWMYSHKHTCKLRYWIEGWLSWLVWIDCLANTLCGGITIDRNWKCQTQIAAENFTGHSSSINRCEFNYHRGDATSFMAFDPFLIHF